MKNVRRLLLFLTLLPLWALAYGSTDYIYTEPLSQHELPVANVHCIYKDREGFVWYGTRGGGLCRDNVYHIEVFRSDRLTPSLIGGSNDITCITEDYDRHLIFSTNENVYLLDKRDFSIRPFDDRFSGRGANPILVAADSTLWFCSRTDIYHYSRDLQLIGSYPSEWHGNRAYASRILQDSHGTLWITQWNGGVICYDAQKDAFVEEYWPAGIIPSNIVEDPGNDCYWVATWGRGIVRYRPKQQEVLEQSATLFNSIATNVIHLTPDFSRHQLWASSMHGLERYTVCDGQLLRADLSALLPTEVSVIDQSMLDEQGNLWVAGFSPHTFILSPNPSLNEKARFPLLAEQLEQTPFIWTSCQEGNVLWIGQDRVGLLAIDQTTGHVSIYSHDQMKAKAELNLTSFCADRLNGGIWTISDSALHHLEVQNREIRTTLVVRTPSQVYGLAPDGEHALLLCCQEGLMRYEVTSQKLEWITRTPSRTYHAVRGPGDAIYYSLYSGELMLWTPDEGNRVISDIGSFYAMAIDGEGTLWAADRQGNLVHHHLGEEQATIDPKGSNTDGDGAKSIGIDTFGHLWIVSDQYLREYSPKSGRSRRLNCNDRDVQMDCFLSVVSEGIRMKVHGAGGILYAKPIKELDEDYRPEAEAFVSTVTIDGKLAFTGKEQRGIEIAPDAATIELQFTTLNYLNPDKVAFAYRIRETDGDWNYLAQGVSKATLVNLGKGHYTFDLMATDEHGCWGRSEQAFYIVKLPAWYETWWANMLYLLVLLAIVGCGLYLYLQRQKEKQQERMNLQLTEMKFRFFTNIGHELRTPLTLILAPVESLLSRLGQPDHASDNAHWTQELRNKLSLVQNNAKHLLLMVNRLLDFRKLEMGQETLELATGDLYETIRTACSSFETLSVEKGIGLGIAIPNSSLYATYDPDKIRHIIYNLLGNAFKFTPEGGHVTVTATRTTEDQLKLVVADTGCGIHSKDLQHIFDRYYQSRHSDYKNNIGTGIGLNLVGEYVKMHKGEISVSSQIGKGTTFTILLPLVSSPSAVTSALSEAEEEANLDIDVKQPHILVVDDNEEFRQFIASELESIYRVHQASNGIEALKQVESEDIDLIISDVMMPEMDGMELCHRLKSNVNTSHIFILLLSARSAESSKMEGYRLGADEYLAKPFNLEMLKLRIHHFLDMRNARFKTFKESEVFEVEKVNLSDIDQDFLRNAMEVVTRNLGNEHYDVEDFAADVHMSRSSLYRKLPLLVGQNPNEFIRTVRLKKAAVMIREKQLSLKEIAYQCGFSSVSYFYRCFRAEFGVPPGQYK